jgi:hypothetical protein
MRTWTLVQDETYSPPLICAVVRPSLLLGPRLGHESKKGHPTEVIELEPVLDLLMEAAISACTCSECKKHEATIDDLLQSHGRLARAGRLES